MSHGSEQMAVLERSKGAEKRSEGVWNQRPGSAGQSRWSEGLGEAWEGFWRGLGGFGRSLGRSASLACPTTLARSVEMWEVQAAVCVWLLCLERFGGFGAGLVALGPCRGCGTVGVRADVWVQATSAEGSLGRHRLA